MKKIKLTLFIAVVGLLLVSCKRDITEPVISSNPTSPTLSDLSVSGAFNISNANGLVTFSWSAANYGFESSTTYTVQLSSTSDFSDNIVDLLTTQNLSGTAKVSEINDKLLAWNFSIGSSATIYYRVSASVTSSLAPIYSATKSTSLTPYDAVVNYPMIYVPGAYQGWSPGAENGRLYSYEGIVRIIDGTNASSDFKITSDPDWNHTNWGGTLTKSGDNYSGILDPAGDNYTVDAGVYAITVDVSALTISLTKTDDWGIIGSAVPPYDWSADVDMFYNGQRKMWEITADFVAGDFKFRANDAWDLNYGDTGADGTLDAGGDNIALPSDGNYTIRFDPVKLTYTVQKN